MEIPDCLSSRASKCILCGHLAITFSLSLFLVVIVMALAVVIVVLVAIVVVVVVAEVETWGTTGLSTSSRQ